ncbi:GLPGLI family protein [Pedobacter antarcticus]|uniref:GLPGLI family protein n=1 Tax=Pedobacter antarcticus TaxID=34086 RepID=UPI00292F0936|nr:GLPGLI family protein [Pedobacter antarcticus]
MKKIVLILCLSIIVSIAASAQTGKISYLHISSYLGSPSDTLQAELNFNGQYAQYVYDRNTYQPAKKEIIENASGQYSIHKSGGKQTDSIGNIVYTDHRNKKMITREMLQSQYFIVPDTVASITWKITGDQKMIAKQSCTKATGNYRGRDYEVWFSPEIPVSYGPWKLSGLPGLIIEARSADGEITFIATHIQIPLPVAETLQVPVNGKPVKDFASFYQLQNKKAEEMGKYMKSMSQTQAIGTSIKLTTKIRRIEKSI